MRAERRHRSARAVLRAATVALMMRPSVDVPSKERGLVAARGPENASLQEAPKFATYGVQINRTKQFCTGCDVEGYAPDRALEAIGGMRAPEAIVANRRSAVRHWRNEVNIRPRDVVVNSVVRLIRSPTIASLPIGAARRRRQCPKARPRAGSKRSGEH